MEWSELNMYICSVIVNCIANHSCPIHRIRIQKPVPTSLIALRCERQVSEENIERGLERLLQSVLSDRIGQNGHARSLQHGRGMEVVTDEEVEEGY